MNDSRIRGVPEPAARELAVKHQFRTLEEGSGGDDKAFFDARISGSMISGTLGHRGIVLADDVARARDFYQRAFGWKISDPWKMNYFWLRRGKRVMRVLTED